MTRRQIKQTIIASVFFLILLGLGFLIYSVTRPDPTCADEIQNQGEEGIDCGGPCLSCELREIGEIKVLKAEAVLNQGNFYDLVAQVRNPNQNYGGDKVSYQFKAYDSDNNLVASRSGSTYILPNQTKYIVQTKVEINRLFNRIEFSLSGVEWEKMANYQSPQLVVQQKEYRLLESQEPGFSQARGILVNKSNFDFDRVDTDILLFNSSGRIVGLSATELRTLLSGQERDIFTTWFSQIDGQVVSIEMEPETNIFDPDNYLATGENPPERFQEY